MAQTRFKIANILLDDTEQLLYAPALLVRSTAPWHRAEGEGAPSGAWTFAPGEHDFTTFFNALSVHKWLEYSVAREFHLRLEVRGSAFTVVQTRADEYSYASEPVEATARRVDASDRWMSVDVPMIGSSKDVLEGFVLRVEGTEPLLVRRSFYYAVVDEAQVRNVELAICTTTFKKEAWITKNVAAVKDRILATTEAAAGHLTMHVVDNGRTLDAAVLEAPRVHVHPNDNVGGSGGYARGMIEAMRQDPKPTHVLLMDDDVVILPESILRTYNLLALVNDAHADHMISGAMMNLFQPDVRWEDVGFVRFDGANVPIKVLGYEGLLHEAVYNELTMPAQKGAFDLVQQYAGWWYCVIPMATVEKNGLPLPFFVRFDDVEYALRCKAKFMTMNGICLWHPSFDRRYTASVERYQVVRNSLMGQAMTGVAQLSDFVGHTHELLLTELRKYNYTNAALVLDAFEDFLEGPSILEDPAATRERYLDAGRRSEQLWPLDELFRRAQEEGIELKDLHQVNYQQKNDPEELRSIRQQFADEHTFFGQERTFGPWAKSFNYWFDDEVPVIDWVGWLNAFSRLRHHKTLVAVDLEHKKGIIRHMDRARYRELKARWEKDLKRYEDHKDALLAAYATAGRRMTTVDWWEGYLGLR